jgi:hypothetical protein
LPGYRSFTDKEPFYWDITLWVIFKDAFQSIREPKEPPKPVHAILFCSYGNETVNLEGRPTPPVSDDARVTLKPRDDLDVSKPCRLLLDENSLSTLNKGSYFSRRVYLSLSTDSLKAMLVPS